MTRRSIAASFLLACVSHAALAQSNPGFVYNQVPTAAQWNSYFSAKQDVIGYVPVNKAGDTMLGLLTTLTPTTGGAGLNLPHGAAPSAPNNGDVWTTTAGMFAQVNGGTIGPFASSTGTAGGSANQVQWNSGGTLAGFTVSGDGTLVTSTGVLTVTKTGGVSFGAIATLGIGTNLASGGGNLNISGVIGGTNGGTGINNGANTIALANTLATSGNFPMTLTATATSNATLPAGTHTLGALDLADQAVTGGANVTSLGLTTGNVTIDCGSRPLQAITANTAAWTITAPASDGSCILKVLNPAASAVVPSFSGFSNGANTGDSLTAANNAVFTIFIWRNAGVSGYRVAAHQ